MEKQWRIKSSLRRMALSGGHAAGCSNSAERFSVVSLFSGCGGMDLGFLGGFDFLGKHYSRNPFDIVWANEINSDACKTYRKNIGEIVEGDIHDVIGQLPQYADVVIGGFP